MEERLTHKKHQNGFPHRGLEMVFDRVEIEPETIDCVAYPFQDWRSQRSLLSACFFDDLRRNFFPPHNFLSTVRHQTSFLNWTVKAIWDHYRYNKELEQNLAALGLVDRLRRVDHQSAHGAAAFYSSGFEEALILTLDWYGDGLAGSVFLGSKAGLTNCYSIAYPNSLGMFYAQVTGALGFRMCHHEGKIVGLAAYGDGGRLFPRVSAKFEQWPGGFRYLSPMDYSFVARLAGRYGKEDVAAAYQEVLEAVVTRLVRHYMREYGQRAIVMAGGVAANVKLNQRVYELDEVEKIFIHPAMGDDGSGTGAALYVSAMEGVRPQKINNAYFGPEYGESEIKRALERHSLPFVYMENIEDKIARLIAQDKVVARFNGPMEYGPRALGNRSILYSTSDPTVNDWLNKRLSRTEFMPFAPATLYESRGLCYEGVEGAAEAARYMTITFNCRPFMLEKSPAAVHVDKTARPQLVAERDNPSFYKIIKRYHQLTGIPSIINTSFNMHEAPIVCTPEDAVSTYLEGKLDHLAIGNFLV